MGDGFYDLQTFCNKKISLLSDTEAVVISYIISYVIISLQMYGSCLDIVLLNLTKENKSRLEKESNDKRSSADVETKSERTVPSLLSSVTEQEVQLHK